MIRITGGKWKGRKLRTPRGLRTRPTPARVRESLFNVLGNAIVGREFHDLYAGAGIVGLEALSRGASRAVLVESHHAAFACLRANAEELGCSDRCRCVHQKLPSWLNTPGFQPEPPVLLFADPPYGKGHAARILETLGKRDIDAEDGICVVQTEKRASLETTYGPWRLTREYGHGDTRLWLYEGAG